MGRVWFRECNFTFSEHTILCSESVNLHSRCLGGFATYVLAWPGLHRRQAIALLAPGPPPPGHGHSRIGAGVVRDSVGPGPVGLGRDRGRCRTVVVPAPG